MHIVCVEYDGGINRTMDSRIFEVADYDFGKGNCDSGCDIGGDQTRDFAFSYATSERAIEVGRKLKDIPNVRVRVELAS